MKRTMIQYFQWYTPGEGYLWKAIKNDIPKLKELGELTLWLPPAFKAAGGGYSVGYDVYDIYDLGEFDQKGSIPTKYGTKEEYIDLLKALHENGIDYCLDVVLNHKMGGDERERFHVLRKHDKNRQKAISEPFEIEAYTKFTFPGRQGKYSDYIWDFHSFTGVDYAADLEETAIFKIINESGTTWEDQVGDEKGNYDYLMGCDIEFRNAAVVNELKYWAKWYYEQTQYNGFRLDAIKHIPIYFYKDFIQYIRSEIKPDLYVVGEYWSPSLDALSGYIDETEGMIDLFDVPLQKHFSIASKSGSDFDMRSIFDGTLVKINPINAVTFVANHDTQPLQDLESPVEPWFKPLAYALILMRQEGFPCVFHPDMYGAEYTDKGNDGGEYTIHMPVIHELEKLMKLRNSHGHGGQFDYFDDPNCLAWARTGNEYHKASVTILTNAGENGKTIEIGKIYAGQTFHDGTGNRQDTVTIDEHGLGTFTVNGGSVSVWIPAE